MTKNQLLFIFTHRTDILNFFLNFEPLWLEDESGDETKLDTDYENESPPPHPPNVKKKKDGKVAKLQVMPGYVHIDADPLVIDAIENIACLLVGSAPDPETRHGFPWIQYWATLNKQPVSCRYFHTKQPRELIMPCNLFEHQKTFTLLCAHRF